MPIKFTPKPGTKLNSYQIDAPAEPMKIVDFAQNYVKYHIHKNLAGDSKPRPHDHVHISDLDPARKWCPREPALLTLHGKERPEGFVSTAQAMVWKWGHKGADIIIESLPPDMVWGNWRCRNCDLKMMHQYTPMICNGCSAGRNALIYQEVVFRDPKTGVTGSCDLFVDLLKNGRKTAVEIKTEGNGSFGKRSKPEFDHEWRTMGYLRLMSASGKALEFNLETKHARILYITKEGHSADELIKLWGLKDWGKSSMKEYIVNRNDEMLDNRMEAALEYRMWRQNYDAGISVPLPNRICSSKAASRAKQCHVCKECFS